MSHKKSGFQITGVSGEAASPPGPGSRFRVVRLGVGTGEPYRRGRWTCRDCYEVPVSPVPLHPSLALRLPHSLDATRAHPGTPTAPQARSLGGPSAAALPSTTRLIQQQELPLSRPASPAPPEGGLSQMVPDPLGLARSMLALDEDRSKQGAPLGPRSWQIQGWAMALDPQGVSVKTMVSSYEARGVLQGCGCCALPDTGNPRHRGCASPAPSRGSSPARAPTMPALGALGSRPGGTDKALLSLLVCVHSAGSGMIAIDNKIEQAMDLVKSHLMLAVREEVELLREQIRELAERGVALERENALLRALATPAQLAQLRPPASPRGGE